MDDIISILKSMKFPSILLREDLPLFQNELFSAHINESDIKPDGVLYPFIVAERPAAEVQLVTRLGKVIVATPKLLAIGNNENLKILTLVDKSNELAQISIEQMESGRFVALGQLASGIAHEINNPLTVVLAKVHLVEKLAAAKDIGPEVQERIKDALGKAKDSVVRISKVIKGLRSLSRDGRLDDFQDTDMAEVINETIELCQERLKANGVILELEVQSNLLVSARPYQIVQVLINLINNAIDAMSDQGIGRIFIKVFNQGSAVIVQVRDSGPGVKPGYEHMIMEPFFTTKTAGVGTGLGLSISRQIIFSHNGKLSLNTQVSKSCFEIELPLIERRAA